MNILLFALGLFTWRVDAQFRFNLGDIFNRRPQNNNDGGNSPPGRVDAGDLLGGLLGAVTNPNRNQNNQGNNGGLGGILNQVVGSVIDSTDVSLGLDGNGQLQVAVVPKGTQDEDDLCVDNSSGSGSTGIRNGPNVSSEPPTPTTSAARLGAGRSHPQPWIRHLAGRELPAAGLPEARTPPPPAPSPSSTRMSPIEAAS